MASVEGNPRACALIACSLAAVICPRQTVYCAETDSLQKQKKSNEETGDKEACDKEAGDKEAGNVETSAV